MIDWISEVAHELAHAPHSYDYVHSCVKRHYESAQPSPSRPQAEAPYCKCESPYLGTQLIGTPLRCERCDRNIKPLDMVGQAEAHADNCGCNDCYNREYMAGKKQAEAAPVDELEQRLIVKFNSVGMEHEYECGGCLTDVRCHLCRAIVVCRAELAAERQRVANEAAKFIEDWRTCDCGHEDVPKRYKYNTQSGHAIDCWWYISAEIRSKLGEKR